MPRTRYGLRVAPRHRAALVAALRARFALDDRQLADQATVKAESLRIFNRTFAVTAALNTFTLGVGQKFTDQWSGTVAFTYEPTGDDLVSPLAPTNGRKGITVNALAPGYFATELNTALLEDKPFSAWVESRTPAGRWAKPEELGGAVVFLASDAAAYVNGHVLAVDGGLSTSL